MAQAQDVGTVRIPRAEKFVGRMRLTPVSGPVGTLVRVEGEGLPPGEEFELVWESYEARWKVEQRDGIDWNAFQGIRFRERAERLARLRTDEEGTFRTTFRVPEDYGGVHDLYLVDPERGRTVNKAGFRVDASAELSPPAGPPGTSILVTVRGLHPAHPIEGWYQLYYDNQLVGFLTAVTTRGTARVEIPAVGEPGTHLIAIENAPFSAPFLELEVSPYHHLKTFHLPFELTDGEPVLPPPVREQLLPEVPGEAPSARRSGPQIWTDYSEFAVHTAFTIYGRGFPPRAPVQLVWYDVAGDRVSETRPGQFGTGFSEMPRALTTVETDDQGGFQIRVVPESPQGGPHAIAAHIDGQPRARTYVRVGKRVLRMHPRSGPVGTPITVEVEGVGWTEHENLIAVTYDNSYVGYGCGNDLLGRVVLKLRATGRAGLHYIDLYPAFYRNQNFSDGVEMPFLYQRPILTWRDHPHGFHARLVFEVEGVARRDRR